MNPISLFLKRSASFVRSMMPKPDPLTIEQILTTNVGQDITNRFIDLYYRSGSGFNMHWRNNELLKNPCDLWVYVELIQEIKPQYIIETGTHHGASALYYSDMAKLLGIDCTVITIDINPKITYNVDDANIIPLVGISTSGAVLREVDNIVKQGSRVIVMLDSDHSKKNVLEELKVYSRYVNIGSYLIVEDSIVNGHPTFSSHGPGPYEAVEDFLKETDAFEVDISRQKFLLTYNNKGYLKKIK